jgi:hypothetical protein
MMASGTDSSHSFGMTQITLQTGRDSAHRSLFCHFEPEGEILPANLAPFKRTELT